MGHNALYATGKGIQVEKFQNEWVSDVSVRIERDHGNLNAGQVLNCADTVCGFGQLRQKKRIKF
jgi:hypothetical protein